MRLAEDLQTILSRSATCLLVLALIGLTGCSSKFETERETTTNPAVDQAQPVVTERSRTAVALDLTRGQEPVRTVSGDLVVSPHDPNLVIVEGCLHVHVHIDKDDRKSQKLAVEILRELQRCQWHATDLRRLDFADRSFSRRPGFWAVAAAHRPGLHCGQGLSVVVQSDGHQPALFVEENQHGRRK